MLTRRSYLGGLLSAAALRGQNPSAQPNVIVILVDDMGYADIGPFGAKDIETPSLDRLAREGVRLTNNYSNGPVCTPTRCGLMTGRYQQRAGLEWALVPVNKGIGLPATETTIARMLKDRGYATALFGKWHLGAQPEFSPTVHGFDEYFGILGGNVDMYSHKDRWGSPDLWEGTQAVEKKGYLTDLIVDRSVGFIDKQASRPFFLYAAFNGVHWPFQPPNRPDDVRDGKTWYDGTRADYKGMLESIDTGIGKILSALDRHNLTDNTIVVFTNDNGGERLSDNRPLFHHKATLWEGGIRVPAIVRWKAGKLPAGRSSDLPTITMDFTASIVAATGAALPAGRNLDGIDLFPVLRGQKPAVERTLFWRIERGDRKQKAARRGPWKLVRDGAIDQLFDLSQDPGERVDLAMKHPKIAGDLRTAIAEWEAEMDKDYPKLSVK